MWYIHKYDIHQAYGGPEEGGWWYDWEEPISPEPILSFATEELAYAWCRELNKQESERRKTLKYGYTSVLSHRESFYSFDVSETPEPHYPQVMHYE